MAIKAPEKNSVAPPPTATHFQGDTHEHGHGHDHGHLPDRMGLLRVLDPFQPGDRLEYDRRRDQFPHGRRLFLFCMFKAGIIVHVDL